MLDIEARPKGARTNGRKPADLLTDDRFRRSIGVNEHDGVTWFNKELFDKSVTWLELPDAASLTSAAKASGYRLDRLEKQLAAPPKWASTTAPTARATKPAASRPDATPASKPAAKSQTKPAKK